MSNILSVSGLSVATEHFNISLFFVCSHVLFLHYIFRACTCLRAVLHLQCVTLVGKLNVKRVSVCTVSLSKPQPTPQ